LPKRRLTAYIDEELFKRFIEKVFNKYGKTSGGAISSAVRESITLWLKEEK